MHHPGGCPLRYLTQSGLRAGVSVAAGSAVNRSAGTVVETMHELLFAQTLLDLVCCEAAAHRGERVQSIRLRVGELSGVEPRALVAAFEARKTGTACADSELVIETVAATWICAECGSEQPTDTAGHCELGFCGDCGCDRIVLVNGIEIDFAGVDYVAAGETRLTASPWRRESGIERSASG
jgi:hydrogenase nickel incorporation protein HypA/HybF